MLSEAGGEIMGAQLTKLCEADEVSEQEILPKRSLVYPLYMGGAESVRHAHSSLSAMRFNHFCSKLVFILSIMAAPKAPKEQKEQEAQYPNYLGKTNDIKKELANLRKEYGKSFAELYPRSNVKVNNVEKDKLTVSIMQFNVLADGLSGVHVDQKDKDAESAKKAYVMAVSLCSMLHALSSLYTDFMYFVHDELPADSWTVRVKLWCSNIVDSAFWRRSCVMTRTWCAWRSATNLISTSTISPRWASME